MGLTAALHIGRTGLTASQIGIQVAGNNMANAATPGYSRQVARLAPLRGGSWTPELSIGAGAQVSAVQRQVDSAIQSRLWGATADQARASGLLDVYGQLEAVLGELGDNDLSSELSSFFRAWSERANQTQSSASVVQRGESIAAFVRRLRSDLTDLSLQGERRLAGAVEGANDLASRIASVNREIANAEVGGAEANVLRDQRDQLITELSQYFEVTVIDRGREGADVLVGSVPIVLGGQSRGVQLKRTTGADGSVRVSVATVQGEGELTVRSGAIGAALESREGSIGRLMQRVDDLTSRLIWEVNRLHSTGDSGTGFARLTGSLAFAPGDRARAMNDPRNDSINRLPFEPVNGGFLVRVRQTSTGAMTTVRINVDLDNLTNTGAPGFEDDTTPEQLRAALDAVAGISARFTPDGRLDVRGDDGFTFSFGEDTSGVLAALGMNAFFTGTDSRDIAVRSDLVNEPARLAAARYINNQLVENGTALLIAGVQDAPIDALGGRSLGAMWRDAVQSVGGSAAGARSAADAASLVRESLEAQRAAVSGVSLDEESVNLLQYQRQYQASARLISVVDEMTQTLINLV